nr:Enoyl-CoA delta isomerase 2, mitochondrial [Polyrhizophydium stewartii]
MALRRHGAHVLVAAFARPKVLNALSPQAYIDWLAAMRFAAADPDVRVFVLTGEGSYFTAGQQLAPPSPDRDPVVQLEEGVAVTRSLIEEYINFPKLIIAAVNGPALGFGVTTLALADLVYAVPNATFRVPFMELALCVEACSSVTFVKALGNAKAKDMLFMGRTMTAKEWEAAGLVTDVFPVEGFLDRVLAKADQAASYSSDAVQGSLKLVRSVDRDVLLKMNDLEIKLLVERMTSADFANAVASFMGALAPAHLAATKCQKPLTSSIRRAERRKKPKSKL